MSAITPAEMEVGMKVKTVHPLSTWNGVELTLTVVEQNSERDPVIKRTYVAASSKFGDVFAGHLFPDDKTWVLA